MKKILQKISERITPKENSHKEEIKEITSHIESEIKKNKIKADVVIGGSFAKDTHLVGDHDCDIFVRFDYDYKDKNISDLLQKLLTKFKAARVHGSRDYFQFTKSLNYEIVPVLKITNAKNSVNVTDASPLHVAWVKKHKKSDEIRLAKAFCKANSIYGAESYIKGFSGHVLDILTIYYGSFINLLKAAKKWEENVKKKKKTIVDIEKYHKDALFELNTSKTTGPLIVVDPLQRERNAAAALDDKAFEIFIKKAKEFLKNPSEKAFEKHILQKEDVKDAIILDVSPEEGKNDIVGAKMLKAYEEILRNLEKNDFTVKNSGWIWNKESFFWFKLKENKLSSETVIEGPPVKIEQHAEIFRKKYSNTFEKKGRLFAKIKREYSDAKELLKEIIKNEYIKEKVKAIKLA